MLAGVNVLRVVEMPSATALSTWSWCQQYEDMFFQGKEGMIVPHSGPKPGHLMDLAGLAQELTGVYLPHICPSDLAFQHSLPSCFPHLN